MDSLPSAPPPVRGWYPDPDGTARLRWWDGTAWTEWFQHAMSNMFSADRRWWWDGQRWVPAAPGRTSYWRRPPRVVLVFRMAWVIALAVWMPAAVIALRPWASENLGQDAITLLLALLGGVVLGTVVFGFVVGLKCQLRWIWPAAALGTVAQLFGYVIGMVMVPQPNGSEDTAAAVGLVFLSLPTMLVVTVLLWTGAGLGFLTRSVLSRRNRR